MTKSISDEVMPQLEKLVGFFEQILAPPHVVLIVLLFLAFTIWIIIFPTLNSQGSRIEAIENWFKNNSVLSECPDAPNNYSKTITIDGAQYCRIGFEKVHKILSGNPSTEMFFGDDE